MSLLVSLVFPDVVQVVSANDESSHHLHALNNASQDTTTDGDIPCERTLFVDVGSLNSLKPCMWVFLCVCVWMCTCVCMCLWVWVCVHVYVCIGGVGVGVGRGCVGGCVCMCTCA